ncbi:hypothetical protein bpr_II161 (plasmid) [Butyrivibrio proteoclasticus B316]|uniref:Uncharacterized protein n=1 Tax=Butyrivibrio proteoclasticus (strain ATCC 51982 / DSM 14932 / B316) TaxID=515622 RepID=E0S3W7_BUTPB|nr:hypothetical protein [Butyrivibrio proteoclasticus]ADL36099.1 hypothetical protein bpr_II161 [Butyrivibrio proteoclasticus B316]
MLINTYYKGATDKVTGFVYDTDRKSFKDYSFVSSEWLTIKGREEEAVENFKMCGDMCYFMPTLKVLNQQRNELVNFCSFFEAADMVLDFGAFTK